jgi:hypothetical protein
MPIARAKSAKRRTPTIAADRAKAEAPGRAFEAKELAVLTFGVAPSETPALTGAGVA